MVIDDFFQDDTISVCSEEMVRAAELRYKSGNPPGKDNKFGDAINWECLLSNVPAGNDLYFISADKDYASVINDKQFNFFLEREWQSKKHSKIYFYKSLVSFLKEHFSEIQLQTEQEKDDLIAALSASHNFANTHAVIKQLSAFSDWSVQQKEDLFNAALNNSQVFWILDDQDVKEFYLSILRGLKDPSESAAELIEHYRSLPQDEQEAEDFSF